MPHGIDTKLSPAANGTQDFTKSGLGTVKGYLVFNSHATLVGTGYDDQSLVRGASDLTNQGHSSANAEDNVDPSDATKIHRDDELIRVGQIGDYSTQLQRAVHSALVTDGVQLNWTETTDQRMVSALMFAEGVSNFKVDTVTMNATGDTVIAVGFQPDLVIVFNCNAPDQSIFNSDLMLNTTFYEPTEDSYASVHAAMFNNVASHACFEASPDNIIPVDVNIVNGNMFNSFTLGSFTSSGFTATKVGSSGVRVLTFVSIKLESGYKGKVGFVAAPAVTGQIDLITGLTGVPQLAMFIGTNQLASSGLSADPTRATHFVGACTEAEQFTISTRGKPGGAVADVGGVHHADRCLNHINEDNVVVNSASFESFKDGAVSVTFSVSNAANLIGYLVISQDAPLGSPTLSAPTDDAAGATTSLGTVQSDQASGTVYGVVTGSATTPTHAQIKAGQDDTGATADSATSEPAVSGANSLNFAGLTPGDSYFTHFTQENSANDEAVPVSADGFTTPLNTAPVVDSPIPTQVVTIGIPYNFDSSVHFSDPEGDPLTFTATKLPNGLSISSVGVISGTPTGGYQP